MSGASHRQTGSCTAGPPRLASLWTVDETTTSDWLLVPTRNES